MDFSSQTGVKWALLYITEVPGRLVICFHHPKYFSLATVTPLLLYSSSFPSKDVPEQMYANTT